MGWGSRVSPTNYVANHIGSFAAAQEAVCRSLVMGGVPTRFPELRFAFLEGGVAWACDLYVGLVSHFAKRNRVAIRQYDPARFDLELGGQLLDRFGGERLAGFREDFLSSMAAEANTVGSGDDFDDFSESGISNISEIADIFSRQFNFGCESDDALNAMAFRRDLLPLGIDLNAIFSSDIGHWDVPEMESVLPEAWELVERGHLTPAQFREFMCGNAVRMLTAVRPDFFDGTVLEGVETESL
jgi:hypothetical protein